MGRDPRSGRGKRVAQGNGAAVNIQPLAWERQLALYGASLGSESLIHFDEIHVGHRKAGFGERGLGGGHWSDSHHRWIDAGNSPRNKSPEWCETALARKLLARDDHRAGSVTNARRVAGRDYTAFSEYGLECRQFF